MSAEERHVDAPPDAVWAVLADGWLYPAWVVGASRMRHVSPDWPEAGAAIDHTVGSWPLLIDDHTTVVRVVPESLLVLEARAWPAGQAEVVLRLEPTGAGTRVRMEERVTGGPGSLLPDVVVALLLRPRNRESLARLALIAERRSR